MTTGYDYSIITLMISSKFWSRFIGFGLAIAVVLSLTGFAGTPAFAATAEELQAQITALLAQIQALQSQLPSQGGGGGGTVPVAHPPPPPPDNYSPRTRPCPTIIGLSRNSRGNSVYLLQKSLVELDYLEVENVTGFFGAVTKLAVYKFQEDNDINPTGSVDYATAKALGAQVSGSYQFYPYCDRNTGTPYITALSPSSGPIGTRVNFTGQNIDVNDRILIDGYDAGVVDPGIGFVVPERLFSTCEGISYPYPCDPAIYPLRVGSHSVVVKKSRGASSNTVYFEITAGSAAVTPAITTLTPSSVSRLAAENGTQITILGRGISVGDTVYLRSPGFDQCCDIPYNQATAAIERVDYGSASPLVDGYAYFSMPSRMIRAGVFCGSPSACGAATPEPIAAGEYKLSVVTRNAPGSNESNLVSFTVTSGTSATPMLSSLSPAAGASGSRVIVNGQNLSAGQYVILSRTQNLQEPHQQASATLTGVPGQYSFNVPDLSYFVCPNCFFSALGMEKDSSGGATILRQILTPGTYYVFITDFKGNNQSNSLPFTVTSGGQTSTTLTIASATQPANSLAPQGAVNLPFTKFRLTAGTSDVTVTGLLLNRTGTAPYSVFTMYTVLDENGAIVANGQNVLGDPNVTLRDTFTVRAGTSRTYTIAGSISSNVASYGGQTVALQLTGLMTTASLQGTLPITGATHVLNSTLQTGTLSITKSNSSTISSLAPVETPNQVLAAFDTNVTVEPIAVGRMIFRVSSVGGNHPFTNAYLIDSTGRTVAGPITSYLSCSTGGACGDVQLFNFYDTITFPIGTNTYYIKGTIPSSYAGQKLVIRSDVEKDWTGVTGATYGYGIVPRSTAGLLQMDQVTVAGGTTPATRAQPVSALSACRNADSSVVLSWNPPVNDSLGETYTIYRRTGTGLTVFPWQGGIAPRPPVATRTVTDNGSQFTWGSSVGLPRADQSYTYSIFTTTRENDNRNSAPVQVTIGPTNGAPRCGQATPQLTSANAEAAINTGLTIQGINLQGQWAVHFRLVSGGPAMFGGNADSSSDGTSIRIAIPNRLYPLGAWNVPMTNCNQANPCRDTTPGDYRIRLSRMLPNDGVEETNEFPLRITAGQSSPALTVTSPNGGETFTVGGLHRISWSGGKDKVQIGLVSENYNPQGGGVLGWISLEANPNSSLTWDARLTSDLSGTVRRAVEPGRYKIIAVSADALGNYCMWASTGGCNMDLSENAFTVSAPQTTPVITVTSPNGGEQWQLGRIHTILWTPYDPQNGVNPAVSQVKAYLLKNVNGTLQNLGEIIESGKASIHWGTELDQYGNFPQAGGNYYVKIVNRVTGASDLSDFPFTLVPSDAIRANLLVNGSHEPVASVPAAGLDVSASWSSNAQTCTLAVYSYTGDNNQQFDGLPSSGTRTVRLRADTHSVALWCKSTSPIEGNANDSVSVSQPMIRVTSPNGGESLSLTAQNTIRFESANVSRVSVGLYRNDASYAWIARDVPIQGNVSSISWTPSQFINAGELASGAVYKIYLIGSYSHGTVEDKSDTPFTLTGGSSVASSVAVTGTTFGTPLAGWMRMSFAATGPSFASQDAQVRNYRMWFAPVGASCENSYAAAAHSSMGTQLVSVNNFDSVVSATTGSYNYCMEIVGQDWQPLSPRAYSAPYALTVPGSTTQTAATPAITNFSATPASGAAPLTVTFSGVATNIPSCTSDSWSYGDGATEVATPSCPRTTTTIASQNISKQHTYTQPGTYQAAYFTAGAGSPVMTITVGTPGTPSKTWQPVTTGGPNNDGNFWGPAYCDNKNTQTPFVGVPVCDRPNGQVLTGQDCSVYVTNLVVKTSYDTTHNFICKESPQASASSRSQLANVARTLKGLLKSINALTP